MAPVTFPISLGKRQRSLEPCGTQGVHTAYVWDLVDGGRIDRESVQDINMNEMLQSRGVEDRIRFNGIFLSVGENCACC